MAGWHNETSAKKTTAIGYNYRCHSPTKSFIESQFVRSTSTTIEVISVTTTPTVTTTNLVKFQALLRQLFQFDCADLDFGIYRIMNHKRDTIEQFIKERLPAIVAEELNRGPLAQQARAKDNMAEIALRVKTNLGEEAIDERGGLHLPEMELPFIRELCQEYEEAQRQAADGSRSRDAVEAAIYKHLYDFFSRYYEEGDFISKRRYSSLNQRFAIPYNGEEVYLHWANSDQYYVKTDEHFRNYDWKAPNGVSVQFRPQERERGAEQRQGRPAVLHPTCLRDGVGH